MPLILTPPQAVVGSLVTFAPEFFGMHLHQFDDPRNWPTARIGAFRLWDCAGSWAEVQPNRRGEFDFERLDSAVDALGNQGRTLMLTFGRTADWATSDPTAPGAYGPGRSSPPADMNDFRMYVRAVANRYAGRIKAYEIWNEVNTIDFWTGSIAQLVEMTRIAREEVKRADPDAIIVSPNGVGAWAERTQYIVDFMRAGGVSLVDVVGYHLYTSQQGPEVFVEPMQAFREAIRKTGFRGQFWCTEVGYLAPNRRDGYAGWSDYERAISVDDTTAAIYTVRMMLLARCLGFERVYHYSWDNTRLGYCQPDTLAERQNAVALRNFSNLIVGAKLKGARRDAQGVWYSVVIFATGTAFAGCQGNIYWTEPGVMPIRVSTPKGVPVFFNGQKLEVANSVLVSERPVMVVSK